MIGFSLNRFIALLLKEWTQVRRDPITLRFIIALPIMQLFLFGYAINTDPKHLPTGILSVDGSKYERTLVAALENTGYYDVRTISSEADAERALAEGDVQFVIEVPPNFDRSVDRGEAPSVLIDADATDPTAIGNAMAALAALTSALDRDLPPIRRTAPATPAFQFVVHARYNPEQLTVLNIVPGLICIVLMMSTLFMTTLSITRERERGTMENLLAMPVRPIEVMIAKIVPYIFIGYIQVLLILLVSALFFHLPVAGLRAVASRRARPVHRRQSRARHHALDRGDEPDAGDAARPVHLDAVVHAVGLHVPVPRHAGLGAMGRRDFPDDACDAHRARRFAQGQRSAGDRAGTLADCPLRPGRRRDLGVVLSGDAGLRRRQAKRDDACVMTKCGLGGGTSPGGRKVRFR